MLLILTLLACERDPTLLGYWDVVAMRAGSEPGALDEVTQAGFLEFQDGGKAYAMFSYVWYQGAWQVDPRPDLVQYDTSVTEGEDFVEGYKEEGETYTATLSAGGGITPTVFAVEEWAGSSVTLATTSGDPPGAESGAGLIWELDLER